MEMLSEGVGVVVLAVTYLHTLRGAEGKLLLVAIEDILCRSQRSVNAAAAQPNAASLTSFDTPSCSK